MRGFLVTGPGEGKVDDAKKPTLKPGQALIRLEYAGVCGGDPGIFANNNYGATPEHPRVYGHEFYGEIVEINNPENRPSAVKLGDMVVGPQNAPCGVCDQCIEGRFSICSAMHGEFQRPGGCFAEYMERDLDKLFKIEPGVDPYVAAITEPLAIAVFDIRNSGISQGDTVFVIGAGAVGILIGLLARHNGAKKVVFAEVSEPRIEFMKKELGFETYHSAKDDVRKKISEETDGAGVDFVFEVSGAQPGWDLAWDAVRQGGSVLLVGLPNKPRSYDMGKLYRKEIDLVCLNMHHLNDFAQAVNLVNRGELNSSFRKLVTSVWPLEKTKEALEASMDKSGRDIKILLKPGLKEIQTL